MKLHKEIKPIRKVPLRGHNGFYKCPCGNTLTGYLCQTLCEACNAELDWDSVLVTRAELEQDKRERKGTKCK